MFSQMIWHRPDRIGVAQYWGEVRWHSQDEPAGGPVVLRRRGKPVVERLDGYLVPDRLTVLAISGRPRQQSAAQPLEAAGFLMGDLRQAFRFLLVGGCVFGRQVRSKAQVGHWRGRIVADG